MRNLSDLKAFYKECSVSSICILACYHRISILVEPALNFSVRPLAFLFDTFSACEVAKAVLFSIQPLTIKDASIGPRKHPLSLFPVISELAFIYSAVWPLKDSGTVHLVGCPVTIETATIAPSVETLSRNVILLEFTNIARTIKPVKLTETVLSSFDVGTFVSGFIRPCLYTVSVLLIVLPLTLINSSIKMQVPARSIGFIVTPFAYIDISIRVDQAS